MKGMEENVYCNQIKVLVDGEYQELFPIPASPTRESPLLIAVSIVDGMQVFC